MILNRTTFTALAFILLFVVMAVAVFESFDAAATLADARQYEKTQREQVILLRALFLHSVSNMKREDLISFLKQQADDSDSFKVNGDQIETKGMIFTIHNDVVVGIILRE